MSWVFVCGDEVWKLKKPVRYPPLDFSTLELRHGHCDAEVRLNRRLAPSSYLGAHRLTESADGALMIDGDGATVEWLVRMKRLPDEMMLDRLIEQGGLHPDQLTPLITRLGIFYCAAPIAPLTGSDFLARFGRRSAQNRRIINGYGAQIDKAAADDILDRVDRFLETDETLLVARIEGGRIVEGHGDLRAEHVCLTEPPCVIDCLEFDKGLRLVDPFEEIAFLGLDCARRGADWIAPVLRSEFARRLEDDPPDRLIDFYTRFHACVRARLSLAHLDDPSPVTPEKWPRQADAWFEAAARLTLHQ